jgi:hypothetical protein
MESRFGADFSGVRVHDDARAAESARAVDAHAYAVGRDVVFAAGRYAPGTPAGDRLLAHELAHTLQDGAVLRRRVVDDDEHLPCRTTPQRPGRITAADMTAREESAATRAETAAAAVRAAPLAESTRTLLWTRFGLDYNQPRTRCRMIATVADRLADIASEIRNHELTYHCSVTGQPEGLCTTDPANAWTTVGITRRMDLCAAFWGRSLDEEAETLLHEWAHYVFRRRGMADEADHPFDNAACYAAFAYELTGGAAFVRGDLCPANTAPLPARDEAQISAPCPTNVFAGTGIMGGYLTGLPGGRQYGTVGFGWDLRFPLTRMHDWELSVGPRITAAIPGEGGERPPLAYLLGVRTALEFRYRPWRFGFNVGGYAEGGAALAPSTSTVPGETGAYRFNPYAVGGVTGALNIPIGPEQALQIFGQVGAGVGLNTSDDTAFGLFQAGLGIGFEFH